MTDGPEQQPTEFGVLVLEMRLRLGLSQARIAARAGMTDSYVSMLESGRRGIRPSRDKALALAKGLAATPEERDLLLIAANLPLDVPLYGPTFEDFVNHDPRLRPQDRQLLIDMYLALIAARAEDEQASVSRALPAVAGHHALAAGIEAETAGNDHVGPDGDAVLVGVHQAPPVLQSGDDSEIDGRRLLSIAEAARPLGLSPRSAHRQIAKGTFPVHTVRVGGLLKVRPGDLERFLSGD